MEAKCRTNVFEETLPNANEKIKYGNGSFVKRESEDIKNEYESTYSDFLNLNGERQSQFYQENDHSCYYNSSSTVPNTILITNNYSQDGQSSGRSNKSLNKSSITIVTHNSDMDRPSTKVPPSAGGSTVVLDRINICINNHFNDSRTMVPKSSFISATNYQSEIYKEKVAEPDSTTSNLFTMLGDTIKQEECQVYSIGEDVLVERNDGRFYLGTIIAISRGQCLIKFDDDTEYLSSFEELSKFSTNDLNTDPMCVVCKKANKSDIVEVCERCGRGYHRKCAEGSFLENGIWYCRRCTAPNGFKSKNDYKSENKNCSDFVNQVSHKSQLPYNLDSLSWDEHHRVNLEQIYCYCARNGEWYNKMLQCCKCQQWFHAKCVSSLDAPIYAGDMFYIFACAMCNGGEEFLRRLEMRWNDVVHLLLFNLTIYNHKKYYHASTVIVPYAIDNWPALQLSPNMRNLSAAEIRDNIMKTLSMNNSRFKCGKEIKKGHFFWGLRSRIPPPAPTIVIPSELEVTEELLRENTNLNIIPPRSLVNIPKDIDAKMIGSMYLGENSDNESSSVSSDQKFTSDDELPIKQIIEKEKKGVGNQRDIPSKRICDDQLPILGSSDNTIKIGFSSTDSSDKSRDGVDYEGSKEGHVDTDEIIKNDSLDKIHIKHSRKRKSQFFSTKLYQADVKPTEIIDICDSSDETSSRGTLDLIIPPPKNFQGKNNPFRLTPKKKHNSEENSDNDNKMVKYTEISQQLFKSGDLSHTAGQFRIVRTVKRRLSAKDIMIGPNKEVKRRRLRRRSGNVEVISTTTLQSLPKSAAYLPIRTDSREIPVSAIRSSINMINSSNSNIVTTPTNLGPIISVFSGRRLRQRQGKNYSESLRRNSNSSGTTCSNTGAIAISGSPNKSGNHSDVSLTELKTSVNMYFGAVNRIASGENFVIRAKRMSPNGKIQYLIEWEGIS